MKTILSTFVLAVYFMGSSEPLAPKRQVASSDESRIEPYVPKCVKEIGTFSFKPFDPQPGSRPRVRSNQVLYRGIRNSKESNPERFIRAAFGDTTAFFSTWALSVYSEEFMGRNDRSISHQLRSYFSHWKIDDYFNTLKICFGSVPEEDRRKESLFLAAALIDHTFHTHAKNNRIEKRYLDYGSKDYIDFISEPGHGYQYAPEDKIIGKGEMIFSSNRYTTARGYAQTYILGFHEVPDRSNDGNNWNKANGFKRYAYYPMKGIHPNDIDEFIIPGYVAPQDIYMLEYLGGSTLLKLNHNGEAVVAVVKDHDGLTNILAVNGDPEQLNGEKINATLLGFIKACRPAECRFPFELMDIFTSKERVSHFSHELEATFKNFDIKGKPLAWLPLEKSSVEVLSASYGGIDVTAKAFEFCKDKSFCDYKVRQKFVFSQETPGFKGEFLISWKCTGNARVFNEKIKKPAENKKLALNCN